MRRYLSILLVLAGGLPFSPGASAQTTSASTPAPSLPSPPSAEQPGWPPTSSPGPVQFAAPPSQSVVPPDSGVGSASGSGSLGVLPTTSSPRWDISFDALWLARSTDRGVHLGWTDYNPSSSAPPTVFTHDLWSDDALFPLAPGIRVQIAGQVTDSMSIEGIGWGLQQWSVGRTIYADPSSYSVLAYSPWLQVPALLNDGMDDRLGYTYHSDVANVELNQRFKLNPYDPFRTLSFLWGVRYFHIADEFTLSGSDLYNAAEENLEWKTNNNLIGMQVGLQWAWTWDRFQLGVEAKLGLYANVYSQHGTDSGFGPGFIAYDDSHSGTDLGTLVEVSLQARYRVTQSCWVRGGYQFYGAGGLALGPRQLPDYNASGGVCIDGLSVGVEFTH